MLKLGSDIYNIIRPIQDKTNVIFTLHGGLTGSGVLHTCSKIADRANRTDQKEVRKDALFIYSRAFVDSPI